MEVTTHAPGTFCWFELGTTDANAATTFYTQLFDWDANDVPMDEGGAYTMLEHGGKEVGALYPLNAEQRQQGVPPHWLSYVAAEDANATAARVKEQGGTVLVEPMDISDLGRMAVFQDPTGAAFAVWQARGHVGAGLLGAPGSVCWNELATRDAEAAEAFYTTVFDWNPHVEQMDFGPYTMLMRDAKQAAGGMMQMTEEWGDTPSHWMTYFAVDDCDAHAEKAAALGGNICVPPMDIPVGRFAVIDDPQGATFSIIQLKENEHMGI